ncbi:hypothetical protein MRB53_031553 [Persea americana]|uniref:Uncharacterized protein n=1 Tax=Persea americana TaxID=3435 RepID=A0ACC2KPU7_PERAE|nr:hypothetical protein MRB53_031553 [Persea americana]|eukprot:TRINITY_DN3193_c1_g1_i1.p1 TRINITY_DN3193_c1_g1~~TRINITY_DN3193_c1_g1_i1.p1  ORF type:complete len:523 (+),score=112.39 TRINITY_DN3193_c1_g1_i1:179-1570(+)
METKGSLSSLLTEQLPLQDSSNSTRFQKLLDAQDPSSSLPPLDAIDEHMDFILSQDFFCTPDYITPDGQHISNNLEFNKENIACPKSPEKSKNTAISKRRRQEGFSADSFSSNFHFHQQGAEPSVDAFGADDLQAAQPSASGSPNKKNYVSQSAVALRCRVMPPVCIKNPYLNETNEMDLDIFGSRRSKSTGFFPSVGGDGLSRYRTDFHEIEQIGFGNFSRVFKVLKRIDGCMYAVKHSIRQLHHDMDRRRALMEVQALAALGSHENIVGYYTSWFENEQLYIQMELCDHSLSINKYSQLSTEGEVLEAMYQIARGLKFIHERGVAHLDVKPDNIYVKHGVYKLGDFGCARLINGSLPIEEGDARYMPLEILNDKFEHLDKVDIFSLGVAIYELLKGSPLPESGPQFMNLREGKISLLPGHSMQLQNLLKVMLDPDPVRRPTAQQLVENLSCERARRCARAK